MADLTSQNADNPANIAARGGNAAEPASFSPRAFSIREFCRQYGIGRTIAYQEMAAGRLRALKVGRRTLITHDAAEAWLSSLAEANTGKSAPPCTLSDSGNRGKCWSRARQRHSQ
jgi:excisionase family DNA binding protein